MFWPGRTGDDATRLSRDSVITAQERQIYKRNCSIRRVSREGVFLTIRDFTGLIGLAMTAWLVLPNLTSRERCKSSELTHDKA